MSFSRLLRRIKRGDIESFHLIKYTEGEELNIMNEKKSSWVTGQEIKGLVQELSELKELPHGGEEFIKYKGFFEPNFHIPQDELSLYRIEQKTYVPFVDDGFVEIEKTYYKIVSIDRNLFLRGKRSHYEMDLQEDKKWPNIQ